MLGRESQVPLVWKEGAADVRARNKSKSDRDNIVLLVIEL